MGLKGKVSDKYPVDDIKLISNGTLSDLVYKTNN